MTDPTSLSPAPATGITPQRAVRALRAPALALLITFGAAIVMSVLLLAALALAGDGGNDSEALSATDDSGLLFLLGFPFQLTAMALLGTLHTSNEVFNAGLFAPPLLLTAVFVVSLYFLSRSEERRTPSASAGQRSLLAGINSGFVVIVAMVLARVFAARSDDLTVHAASASLLFGSLFLTFVGDFAGRWSAAGSVWPAWVNPEYVVGARLWAQQLAVWVVLALPVAFVVALIRTNLATAITTPVWGPTSGLYAYVLGHLSTASVGGESFFVWEDSLVGGLVLILLALVGAVLTAIAWHLRRLRPAAADLAGWAILPVVFAAGGVVVWLLSIVSVSGDFFLLSGSVTLQPALWLIFVLAAWGALVETLSRTLAPQLATSLSERVRARLTSQPPRLAGATALAGAPTPPVAPAPELTPEQRARTRRLVITAGAALAVVVVAGIAYSVANSKVYGPSGSASAYLDAVSEADVARAIELAPLDDSTAGDDLMDPAVYADAENRVTGYDVTSIKKSGNTAVADVKLKGVEGEPSVELNLEKDGHTHGIFDRWQVTDGGLASVVTVELPEGAGPSLEVNDHPVSLESSADLWALPGSYRFDPFAGSRWMEAEPAATKVSPAEFGAYAELPEPQPSEELRTEIQSQMDEWLTACMQSEELDPDDCPQEVYAYGDSVRNVTWTLDSEPELSFDYFDGTFPADLSVEGGQATATYEEDQSYGFGPQDWQRQSETSTLDFSASVDVAGDEVNVEFDAY